MSFGFQSTRCVDWNSAANGQLACCCGRTRTPQRREAQVFDGHDFPHRSGVMDLHHGHVVWTETGLLIRELRSPAPNRPLKFVGLARDGGRDGGPSNLDRPAAIAV